MEWGWQGSCEALRRNPANQSNGEAGIKSQGSADQEARMKRQRMWEGRPGQSCNGALAEMGLHGTLWEGGLCLQDQPEGQADEKGPGFPK